MLGRCSRTAGITAFGDLGVKKGHSRFVEKWHTPTCGPPRAIAVTETASVTPSNVDRTSTQHPSSFLSEDEIKTLSSEQAAFLVRKRKAAAGLGPVMPESSQCRCCVGIGTCTCHQCNGSGLNTIDKAEEIFDSEVGIYVRNGLIDVKWMFMKNAPCWLCKGQGHVACADCGGTGIAGGVDRYTGD